MGSFFVYVHMAVNSDMEDPYVPETNLRSPMGTRHHYYDPDKTVQPHSEAPPTERRGLNRYRRSAPTTPQGPSNPTLRQIYEMSGYNS